MSWKIYKSEKEVMAVSMAVDKALGYPRHEIVSYVGNGRHEFCICNRPGCVYISNTYAIPRKHPVEDLWAYIIDDNTKPVVSRWTDFFSSNVVDELGEDWYGKKQPLSEEAKQ